MLLQLSKALPTYLTLLLLALFLTLAAQTFIKPDKWKKLPDLFTGGKVVDGDHFLFTDAWHPGIINLKYMAELLGIKVKIHALWHAGSYDPQDFLGRLIGDAPWVSHVKLVFIML
jgi:hypothetical protein